MLQTLGLRDTLSSALLFSWGRFRLWSCILTLQRTFFWSVESQTVGRCLPELRCNSPLFHYELCTIPDTWWHRIVKNHKVRLFATSLSPIATNASPLNRLDPHWFGLRGSPVIHLVHGCSHFRSVLPELHLAPAFCRHMNQKPLICPPFQPLLFAVLDWLVFSVENLLDYGHGLQGP